MIPGPEPGLKPGFSRICRPGFLIPVSGPAFFYWIKFEKMTNNLQEIRELLAATKRDLFAKPNVVATGIGYKTIDGRKTGEMAIICSVETKVSSALLESDELIPPYIQEIPTDVRQVGQIKALQLQAGRYRPAPGGVSAGHFHITAGTLGCLVNKEGKVMILSNNHVLANSNQSKKGDAVLQPGPHDGGRIAEDQIALLSDFIQIQFETKKTGNLAGNAISGIFNFFARLTGSKVRLYPERIQPAENLVDCAIAEVMEKTHVMNKILQTGAITGLAEGTLDMKVKKSGRTTGLTHGVIEQIDVTARVSFGTGKTAVFTDQLMTGAMSQGGDSGSVIMNGKNEAVGLLFAGSINTTIINRIQNVMNLLEIELL
jgi:hypothetical protein